MGSDLVRKFIEWALENRRWPFLLPFSIPVGFRFVQQYYGLSFRDTVWNGTFWLFSAVVAVVTLGLYFLVTRRNRKLGWLTLAVGVVSIVSVTGWNFLSARISARNRIATIKAAQSAIEQDLQEHSSKC